MTITQALSLDVARESVVRISAKQFDENSRFLLITVLESGQEQTIPSASTITLNGRRPDGSSQSFLGSVQDGKAYLKIDDYLLEQYGTVYCSVSIIGSDGAKLSTLSFRMVVERAESTGWVLMYTAPSALSAGTYHINVGSISYQFTLTQALPVGGCIYFASDYTGAKTVVNGADVEALTLTVGTGGTELIGSDVVNFLTQISAEVSSINEGLESKADKSAIEDNLTAGTSLATIDPNSYTANTSPYLYRQSPSGKRCEMDIIGGTVGWNQLVPSINTFSVLRATVSYSGDVATLTVNDAGITAGRMTLANSASIIAPIASHKYIIHAEVMSATHLTSASLRYGNSINSTFSNLADGQWNTLEFMSFNSNPSGIYFQIDVYGAFASGATCQIRNFYTIDLTTLLGSTIADYAYTLESNTSGSGIAWLRSFGFLTKSYYPYCEPTLESVQATARVAVGINQWDEEWEASHINSTGTEVSDGTYRLCSTNYIPVIPNTEYCFTCPQASGVTIYGYDSNKNFTSRLFDDNRSFAQPTIFTTTNAVFIKFQMYAVYGQTSSLTYKNDICINISNSAINGTYYSSESHTYPLDSSLTLRGIPKLDSNNNIYYDGDKYGADGTVTRNKAVQRFTGDEAWSLYTSKEHSFRLSSTDFVTPPPSNILREATTHTFGWNKISSSAIGTADGVYVNNTSWFIVTVMSCTTLAEFKAYLASHFLALAYDITPTTETADSFTPIQYTGSTESFTTSNDVPVGVDAKYYTDLTLPKLPTANGTYSLKCTVTDGVGIVSWVSE